MSVIPYQPTLPAEAAFSDAELDFMESEPPGLFPQNQNSNFGFIIRKIWADRVQELIDQQDTIYNERFVSTSTQYLDEWETMESVPQAPSGTDVGTRQTIVLNRIRKGPFTRALRKRIVEDYIAATYGTGVSFSPSGVLLDASGTPLYADALTSTQAYEIIEDIPNFSYIINIDSSITPASGLVRELNRITPAGISYTLNYVTNPVARLYWPLDDPAGSATVRDLSPYAHPGTVNAGVSLGNVTYGYTSALFSDSGATITTGYQPFVLNSSRTFFGWANRHATTNQDTLWMDSAGNAELYLASGSQDANFRTIGANAQAWAAAWPGINQWVHWALTYNDSTKVAELFISGISKGTKTMSVAYGSPTATFQLSQGGTASWNGDMRGFGIYERILTAAEIQALAHNGTPF